MFIINTQDLIIFHEVYNTKTDLYLKIEVLLSRLKVNLFLEN